MNERSQIGCFPADWLPWMLDAGLRQRFKDTVLAAQGVHIHGIWEPHCVVAARIAASCKRPYMISAHGMLEPWGLRQKRIKKAVYKALVEGRSLQRAACLRALTRDEVGDYRRAGVKSPVAIIPSGVEEPSDVSGDVFRATHPNLAGKRIILFLGRLHYKKGLHLLLRAWARVAPEAGGVQLVIAGPDSGNTLVSLQKLTEELGIQNCVTFAGMLTGERKWSAVAAASLFVLPSYSEGFSIAVLEALARGVPVIVTFPCHIPEVAQHDCGWVIEPEVAPLERALKEFLELSAAEASRMGERGRDLIRTRFHWSVIGKQMAEVYDWLLGGPRPSAVEVA